MPRVSLLDLLLIAVVCGVAEALRRELAPVDVLAYLATLIGK